MKNIKQILNNIKLSNKEKQLLIEKEFTFKKVNKFILEILLDLQKKNSKFFFDDLYNKHILNDLTNYIHKSKFKKKFLSLDANSYLYFLIIQLYQNITFKQKMLLISNEINLVKWFLRFFKIPDSLNNKEFIILQKFIYSLIFFLKEIGFIKIKSLFFPSEVKESGRWKKCIFLNSLIFTDLFAENFFFYYNLPMVCPPKNWIEKKKGLYLQGGYLTEDSEIKLVHKIKNGTSKFNLGGEALKSLNLIQQKGYKINKNALYILKNYKNLFFELLEINLSKIKALELQLNELDHLLTKKTRTLSKTSIGSLVSKNNYQQKRLIQHLELEKGQKKLLYRYSLLYNELRGEKTALKIFNYTVELATIFQNHDLWFTIYIDFRGRNYPTTWVLHRCSGFYKHLLIENSLQSFTIFGIKNLICFLIKNLELYSNQINFLQKGDLNLLNVLWDILNNKSIDLQEFHLKSRFKLEVLEEAQNWIVERGYKEIKKKNIIFLLLIYIRELLCWSRDVNYQTGILMELDMKASGAAFYAAILREKKIAEQTKLIKNYKGDLYTNIGEYILKIIQVNDIFFNWTSLFNFDRNFFKKLVMQMFYGLTFLGVKKLIKTVLVNNHEGLIDKKEFNKYFNSFVILIYDSVQKYTPNIFKFMKLLKTVVKILMKKGTSIQLKTFDQCYIRYKYTEPLIPQVQYFKNPITKKKTTITVLKRKSDITSIEYNSMENSFPPNFIHGLCDATCMRMIVLEFYDRLKRIIEPIHDAFRISPNDYFQFIDTVKTIFERLFGKISKFLNRCLWQPLLKNKKNDSTYVEEIHKINEIKKEINTIIKNNEKHLNLKEELNDEIFSYY